MSEGDRSGRHERRRLLQAAGVTSLGDGLTGAALPLLALTVTHRAILVATVVACQRLPWAAGLLSGAVVDRTLRLRRLVVTVEAWRGAVIGSVALAALCGQASLTWICMAAVCLGAGETMVAPAIQKTASGLVEEDCFAGYCGRMRRAEVTGENLAGPGAGGVLFGLVRALPFGLDALSYLANAWLLSSVIPAEGPRPRPASRLRSDVAAGAKLIRGDALLRRIWVITVGLSAAQFLGYAVLPLWAVRVGHLGPAGYGLFLALSCAGDVVGASLTGWVELHLGRVQGATAGAVLAGLGYVVVGCVHDPWMAAGGLSIEALGVSCASGLLLALRLTAVDPSYRGRVSAASKTGVNVVIPIAAVIGGVIGSALGLAAPWLVGGALALGVAALGFPGLSRAGGRTEVPPARDQTLVGAITTGATAR